MKRVSRLLKAANTARLGVYLLALWKLFKHPETPRAARWLSVAVLAYAVSPIDLIPDFIPVLGLLDEVVLLPMAVALVVRLTPQELWHAQLQEAEASREQLPRLVWGAVLVLAVWLAVVVALLWWVLASLSGGAP